MVCIAVQRFHPKSSFLRKFVHGKNKPSVFLASFTLSNTAMSTNDVLDVLNIQRHELKQPNKKKQKIGAEPVQRQTGMARELYNLLGPNTPPVALSSSSYAASKDKLKSKASPWTKMAFNAQHNGPTLHHWVKGSKELLEASEEVHKPYAFAKYAVQVEIPTLFSKEKYEAFMDEVYDAEIKKLAGKYKIEQDQKLEEEQKVAEDRIPAEERSTSQEATDKKSSTEESKETEAGDKNSQLQADNAVNVRPEDGANGNAETGSSQSKNDASQDTSQLGDGVEATSLNEDDKKIQIKKWSYEETEYLFDLCQNYELKWALIHDRYKFDESRTLEDLKEHFYRVCVLILEEQANSNPALVESLKSYSKTRELERKNYLENLLKRTPAEIAEEESLVIEARRFELAAKKMLMERSNLLSLLDTPQGTLSVLQYLSSQGVANLYNNLMILDKNHKKRQQLLQKDLLAMNQEPIPPTIPTAASSSAKKDRSFQTHLQHYLASYLKQNQNVSPALRQEAKAIQQLLAKRLTQKEEEAYGLHFHGTERLTAGVTLRSAQKLPGLQQKQSTLKSVALLFQELDIPTAGGTTWRPIMPTRKTMSKYDELLRSVVTLLDVKKGRDKLESEIKLIKSQRGLE